MGSATLKKETYLNAKLDDSNINHICCFFNGLDLKIKCWCLLLKNSNEYFVFLYLRFLCYCLQLFVRIFFLQCQNDCAWRRRLKKTVTILAETVFYRRQHFLVHWYNTLGIPLEFHRVIGITTEIVSASPSSSGCALSRTRERSCERQI